MSGGFGSIDRPVRLWPYRKIVGVGWGSDPIVVLTVTAGVPGSPHWSIEDFHRPIPPGVGEQPQYPGSGSGETVELPRDAFKHLYMLGWGDAAPPPGTLGDVIYAIEQLWVGHYITENLRTQTRTQSLLFNFKYAARASLQIFAAGQSTSFGVAGFPPTIYTALPTFVNYQLRGFPTGAVFTLQPDGTVSADRAPTWSAADTVETPLGHELSFAVNSAPDVFIRFDKNGVI